MKEFKKSPDEISKKDKEEINRMINKSVIAYLKDANISEIIKDNLDKEINNIIKRDINKKINAKVSELLIENLQQNFALGKFPKKYNKNNCYYSIGATSIEEL